MSTPAFAVVGRTAVRWWWTNAPMSLADLVTHVCVVSADVAGSMTPIVFDRVAGVAMAMIEEVLFPRAEPTCSVSCVY